MRPLTMLMVTDGVFPDRIGGSYRYLYEVARRLSARGHEVHVVAPSVSPAWPYHDVVDGFHLWRVEGAAAGPGVGLVGRAAVMGVSTRRLVESLRPDVVGAHWPLFAWAAGWARADGRPPLVYHFYGPWGAEFRVRHRAFPRHQLAAPLAWMMHRVERAVVRSAARVLCLSDYSARQVARLHGVPQSKIGRARGAVDVGRFRPAEDRATVRRALGIAPEERVLLTVRRLDARMGIAELLASMEQAFVPVRSDLPPTRLLIIGDGPLRDVLHARVQRPPLHGRVRLVGRVSEERLIQYYQAADCFLLPTQDLEGFGLATVEAMACGLPVLATPVGATPEVLGPLAPCGLFTGSSPAAMSKRLRTLIHGDWRFPPPAVWRTRACENFTWQPAIDNMERQYHEAARPESR